MKKFFLSIGCVFIALCFFMGFAAAKERVIVYTSMENDEIVEYLELAKKQLPDLDIHAIRLSTGELGARMLAEKDNPQADCVWGWGLTNQAEFVSKGMLVPYKPKGWDMIPSHFKDPNGYWTGISVYGSGFIVNTKLLESQNLPMPKGWNDLLNPVYKNKLIMPNPASSGTGFLMIAGLLETLDPNYKTKPVEDNKAWDFLKKLDKNMGQYIKSGSKPAKLTAAGEYTIGLSFAFVYRTLKNKGFPVALIIPEEGFAYEMEANSLLKGAKNEAAAKKFLDWSLRKSFMEMNATYKIGVTYPGIKGPAVLPSFDDMKLFPMDFPWQSKNRAKILEVWQGHFLR